MSSPEPFQIAAATDRRISTGDLNRWHFDRKTSSTPKPDDRRTSTGCFDHEGQAGRTAAYVPQYAASQFARTTTVESLVEKANINHLTVPSPFDNPRSISSARRSHCTRSGLASPLAQSTIPETPELNDPNGWEPKLESLFWANNLGQGVNTAPSSRKMSAVSDMGYTESSRTSMDVSHDGRSSQGPSRRGSTAAERRESILRYFSTVNDHRVDWSQSDEPMPGFFRSRKNSLKQSLKTRLGSISKPVKDIKDPDARNETDEKDEKSYTFITELPTPPRSPYPLAPLSPSLPQSSISPKTGFLARFKN